MEVMPGRWTVAGGRGLLMFGVMCAEDCRQVPWMWDDDGKCAWSLDLFMGIEGRITVLRKAYWLELLEGAGFDVVHEDREEFVPPPGSGL